MSNSDLRPHFCSECQKIEIDGTGPKVNWQVEFPYPEVKHRSSQGCDFFSWALKFPTTHLCKTYKLLLYIGVDSEDLRYFNVEWRDKNGKDVSEFDTKRQLYIFSRRDDGAARYIKSRPLERSPARSVRLGWCLEFYKGCLNHKKCKVAVERDKGNTAPARLLDIRPNSELRLCTVHHGETPLYAALSYCWGRSQQQEDAKTKAANVQYRRGGIDIRQLPRSIREAIEVTRRLELSYLWVDALCIVQDNSIDRALELSRMAGIYRGATITISAASANDSTEGFLRNRDLEKAYGNLFRLPYYNKRAKGVVEGSVFLSEHPIADTRQENIDKRAWTMQEHMLSLRLLRFGSRQTTWSCRTYPLAKKIDGGGSPTVENVDHDFSVNDPYRNIAVRSNILASGSSGPSCALGGWLNAIHEYTLRTLTDPRDRLPACAALAENFADIMGFGSSEYFAGLWKENIHEHLLWHRLEKRNAERISGPSWSWASINGPIHFLGCTLLASTLGANIAKYVDSSMEYKFGDHKYSEVIQGRIELNGRRKDVYWDSQFLRRSRDDADVLPLEVYWDVSDGVRPDGIVPQPVWCFEVFGAFLSLGLVLVRKDQTSFMRVGCFQATGKEGPSVMKSFFNEAEPRNIVLY